MTFDDARRATNTEGTEQVGLFGPARVFLTTAGSAAVSRETHRSGDYSYQRWSLRSRPQTEQETGVVHAAVRAYLPERGTTKVTILGGDGGPAFELLFAGRTLDEVLWIAER